MFRPFGGIEGMLTVNPLDRRHNAALCANQTWPSTSVVNLVLDHGGEDPDQGHRFGDLRRGVDQRDHQVAFGIIELRAYPSSSYIFGKPWKINVLPVSLRPTGIGS